MKSLVQLQSEIQSLQQQAHTLRTKEFGRTVKDIVAQMAAFGISFGDLKAEMQRAGGRPGRKPTRGKPGRPKSKAAKPAAKAKAKAPKGAKPKTRKPAAIKYRGPAGEAWSGRGKTPTWLKAQLEAGKTVEEFRV